MPLLAQLPDTFRTKAADLEAYAPAAAFAWRAAAAELEAVLVAQDAELLTLEQAAKESGLSGDHLRHLVATGKIPNAGAKGRPRIARRHLPKRASPSPRAAEIPYDPTADAISIESRRIAKKLERAK